MKTALGRLGVRRSAVGFVAISIAIAGCTAEQQTEANAPPTSAAPSGDVVVRASSYSKPAESFEEMAILSGDRPIILATVLEVGAPVWNAKDGNVPPEYSKSGESVVPTIPHFIYQPITVRVDNSFDGQAIEEGSSVVIRAIGGSRDGIKYEAEGKASAEHFVPGSQVLLFTQPSVTTDDGLTGFTPNNVVLVGQDGVARSIDGKLSTPLDQLVSKLESFTAGRGTPRPDQG